MANPKLENICHKLVTLAGLGFLGIGLLIIGIYFLCIYPTSSMSAQKCLNTTNHTFQYDLVHSLDYWNCTNDDNIPCYNMSADINCTCSIFWKVPQSIKGDIVIAYQLDTFNETVAKDPKFYNSRDDNQIRGILNTTVSEACEPFAYDAQKVPIAPCGQLADAMLTDTIHKIYMVDVSNIKILPSVAVGLLHEDQRIGFRNPENFTDLKNFSKPVHWQKHIWQLDLVNPGNNGFQNEAFEIWMRQDLPVKPMWRLDRTMNVTMFNDGIPKGEYVIEIDYHYPYSFYKGPRTLHFYRETKVTGIKTDCEDEVNGRAAEILGLGIFGVVMGIILTVVFTLAVIWYYKVKGDKVSAKFTPPSSKLPEKVRRNEDHIYSNDTETTLITSPSLSTTSQVTVPEKLSLNNELDEDYL